MAVYPLQKIKLADAKHDSKIFFKILGFIGFRFFFKFTTINWCNGRMNLDTPTLLYSRIGIGPVKNNISHLYKSYI